MDELLMKPRKMSLSQAVRMINAARHLCMRPEILVNSGRDLCYTIRGKDVTPVLPTHVPTLNAKWVVQTIASVEREIMEFETGVA